MLMILCFCCAFSELEALAVNVPKPATASKTPARTTKTPIKIRTLKKADREADFFFMGVVMWIEFESENVLIAKPSLRRQHFFQFL